MQRLERNCCFVRRHRRQGKLKESGSGKGERDRVRVAKGKLKESGSGKRERDRVRPTGEARGHLIIEIPVSAK